MKRDTRYDRLSGIEETRSYQALVRGRKRLVVPSAIILLGMLLVLATLTTFTSALDAQIVPGLNWAVVYAYVVFLAPVLFSHLYTWRADYFDRLGEEAIREAGEREGSER